MAWINYATFTATNQPPASGGRTWHYNSSTGGVTTGGYNTSLLVLPVGVTAAINYANDSSITFNKNKNYYFETVVSNFVTNNQFLRMRVGHYRTSGIVDFWEGTTKIIDWKTTLTLRDGVNSQATIPLGGNIGVNQVLQFFSSPEETFTTKRIDGNYPIAAYFGAKSFSDGNANNAGTYPNDAAFIHNLKVSEIDFYVQGWALQKEEVFGTNVNGDVIGWVYDGGTYSWRTCSTQSGTKKHALGSMGNQNSEDQYFEEDIDIISANNRWSINNYIAKELVDAEIFNVSFNLIFSTQSGICPIYMYLDSKLPTSFTDRPERGLLIASFTQSNNYNFYNLNGGKFLYFVGGTVSEINSVPVSVRADIGNISVISGYSEVDNNKLFAFQSTLDPFSEPTPLSIEGEDENSTYETISITNQTTHITNSGFVGPKKLTFQPSTTPPPVRTVSSNSGGAFFSVPVGAFNLRPASDSQTTAPTSGFSTVGFFSNTFGTVSGLSQLNSKVGNGRFNAGVWENGIWNSGWRVDENVFEFNDISLSISLRTENVRWRIQVQGSTYSVSEFNVGEKVSIGNIVAIDINGDRKLLKNYFTIVDKNETNLIVEVDNIFPVRRIEKDSPNHKILITKNVWLNGGFLNGYFKGVWNDGLFKGYPVITEMYNSHWIDGKFDGGHFYAEKPEFRFVDTYYWEGSVGLTFGMTAHGLLPGDLVTIDKDDKSINPTYDGDYTITRIIDDYLAITDATWGENTANEGGIVGRRTSTGLIQNFTFYDNNYSRKTSRDTFNKKDIWRYGSWIDVNYSDQSTTNINSSRIYNNPSTTNFLQWRDKQKFGIGDYGVLNLHGFVTDDILSSTSYFRGLDSVTRRAYNLGTKYQIYQDFLGDISNFNEPFNSDIEQGTLDNFYGAGWTFSFSGIESGTYSYINILTKQGGASSAAQLNLTSNNAPPIWTTLTFTTGVENSFGALISEPTANQIWQVATTGLYNINITLPSNFDTTVTAPGISGVLDNDYLFLTSGATVGKIRIIRYRNNTSTILLEKTIKTTGGDFNVGTTVGSQGEDTVNYTTNITIELDWKGELENGDQISISFQRCDTRITNYNSGGPWRGSGFEQGFGLNDSITNVSADWKIFYSRKITISNSGVDNSKGYNFKRTSDGTLFVEHLPDSFHSLTLNNSNINIERNRYSMIEFDLLQSPSTQYEPIGESYSFHFTDLYNFTTFINSDLSYSSITAFPSAPLLSETIIGSGSTYKENPKNKTVHWSGLDYTKTLDTKKREFFFNRPGLDLGLLAEQRTIFRNQIHELDNIKFYEVDMIPFFQYTTSEYVDTSIKIPYQAKSPVIDYSNTEFSLIESVVIGFDSIDLQSSNTTYVSPSSQPFIFNQISSGASSGGSSTTFTPVRSFGL